jgi:hypothetical protein
MTKSGGRHVRRSVRLIRHIAQDAKALAAILCCRKARPADLGLPDPVQVQAASFVL